MRCVHQYVRRMNSMSAAISVVDDARRPPRCSASETHECDTLFRHPCVGVRGSLLAHMSLCCCRHALSFTRRTHVARDPRPSVCLSQTHLIGKKTDVSDLWYDSPRTLWVACKDRISRAPTAVGVEECSLRVHVAMNLKENVLRNRLVPTWMYTGLCFTLDDTRRYFTSELSDDWN